MTDLLIGTDTFRIEVDGDTTKPALLLAHSLGSDLSQWDAQMPALLKAFRVIRYDSRGHGGSTVADAPYSIAMLGRDALGILDALEIDTAHVIGISMGGAVAQWLLTHAPGRIARAVLANTTARFGATDGWNSRIVEVLGGGMSGLADQTMTRWFGDAFVAGQARRVDAVRAVFEATAPEGYAGCCAAIRDLDLREALHAVAAPVLVISGRDDPSIGAADIAHLVETIPGAKHVALEARHISNIEADAAFTKAVVAFLTAKLPAKTVKPKSAKPKSAQPSAIGAKAIVARRVGKRRSTAARIPLTAAPTRATGKGPGPKAGMVLKASRDAIPKKSAAPVAGRPSTGARTSKQAPAQVPAAKSGATRVPAKKAVATTTGAAKRPSAKTLRAMAAGSAPKIKTAKAKAIATPVKKVGARKIASKAADPARAKSTLAPIKSKATLKGTANASATKTPAKAAAKIGQAKTEMGKVGSGKARPTKPVEARSVTARTVKAKALAGKAPVGKAPVAKTPTRVKSASTPVKAASPKAASPKTASTKAASTKTASAKTAPIKTGARKVPSKTAAKTVAKAVPKTGRRAS